MGMFTPRSTRKKPIAKKIADREEDVYDHLKLSGLDTSTIAAIMGNIKQENTNFDYNKTNSVGAHGLFQLKAGKYGKLPHYIKWLKDNKEVDSADSQIDFMLDTIYGDRKYRDIIGAGNAKRMSDVFDKNDDPIAKTNAFAGLWERPRIEELKLNNRNKYTADYSKQINQYYSD